MSSVVITGGTRGLGLELAKCFLKEGYNVVICGTSLESVNKAKSILSANNYNGKTLANVCNVSIKDDVLKLCDSAVKEFGAIDIWINNAGVNQSFKYAWELDEEEIEFLLDVDLKGTINGSTVAMNQMIKQGYGAIYNMEGMGSNDAIQPCFALYGTTKRAVTYYTDALAKEVKTNNLPVVIGKLSPGIMITDFLTSNNGKNNQTILDEKTKNIYNILGDYPDVIAEFLVKSILKNNKNGKRISWLTNRKAAFRFITASFTKRNFF